LHTLKKNCIIRHLKKVDSENEEGQEGVKMLEKIRNSRKEKLAFCKVLLRKFYSDETKRESI